MIVASCPCPATTRRTVSRPGRVSTSRFIDLAWNQGRLDEARPLLAPGFIKHTPTNPNETRDEFLARIKSFRAAFPDLTLTVEEMLADDDRVITRWRIEETHLGVFRDVPPTKRRVRVTGIAIDAVVDGIGVEGWALMDLAGLMAQLR